MAQSTHRSPVASVQITSTANSRHSGISSHDGLPISEGESSSQAGYTRADSHDLNARDGPSPEAAQDKRDHLNVGRQRVRRSAGFLLDPTLPQRRSSSRDRRRGVKNGGILHGVLNKTSASHDSRLGKGMNDRPVDSLGKSTEVSQQNSLGIRTSAVHDGTTSRTSGTGPNGNLDMSPRDSNGSPQWRQSSPRSGASNDRNGKRREDSQGLDGQSSGSHYMDGAPRNNNNNTMSGRSQKNRLSDELSGRSYPLSREVRYSFQDSLDGALQDSSPRESSARQSSASLDPSQLVQMALSLSEGRRRRVSAGLPLSSQSPDKRRVRSSLGASLQIAPGSSLANDQIRASSNPSRPPPQFPSPGPSVRAQDDPYSPPGFSRSGGRVSTDAGGTDASPLYEEEEVEYQFSTATITRAERAKAFFTLASEYRRMLSLLPPLKSDASAPGNYAFQTLSAAAGASYQINRVQTNNLDRHDLGRDYNPLQLLRNRRVRHREQRPLDPPSEVFENVSKVTAYVDQIQELSQLRTYRDTPDAITLPHFRRPSVSDNAPSFQPVRGHKRTDTTATKIVKPIGDWSVTPAELLADAIWLEQKDNKSLIETSRGTKIFPRRERRSLDSIPSARVSRDSLHNSLEATQTHETAAISADEAVSSRGRKKRKLLPTLRNVDNAARKHIFRQRAKSSSSSSTSSLEQRNRLSERRQDFDDSNIGPLDRHMRRLIQNEQLASGKSRDGLSPGKQNRSTRKRSNDLTYTDANSLKSPRKMNGSPVRNEAPTSPMGRRYSYDDSTAPSSPYSPAANMPSFGMSLSPPASRQASPQRKQGFFNLNSKQKQNIQEMDFATKQTASKQNEEASTGKRSFESGRPSMLKRHKTTSSFSSADPTAKDSSVSRFFKGVRIGDILRSETSSSADLTNKKKPAKSTLVVSDISDDDTFPGHLNGEPPLKRRPTDLSRDKSAPQYHTAGLPTFRSHSVVDDIEDDRQPSNADKAQSQPLKEQTSNGASAPPPDGDVLQRPGLEKTSSVTVAMLDDGRKGHSGQLLDVRKNRSANSSTRMLDIRGSTSQDNYATDNASASRPSVQGKRHWSISDAAMSRHQEQTRRFSPQDLARVRALFLASGVKARELHKRACTVVDPPSDFLIHAANIGSEVVGPVPAQDEYLLAAKLLSSTVTSSTDKFRSDIQKSRSERVPALHARFEELKHHIDEKLMPSVQMTVDEADAFTVQLTTHQTLAIKQVNDAVDNILRNRRRRLRMLRKAGFATLEWFVLGLLWVVWLVVVIIRVARGIVKGVVQSVRWFLWL